MDIHDIIRQRLLKQCGLVDPPKTKYTLSDLAKSEWSDEFEQLMRNRLIMGALRYGPIGTSNKPQYKRVDSMIKRLTKYQASGNKELLVDVANLCLLEFVECYHPLAHFHAVDNTFEHVAIAK